VVQSMNFKGKLEEFLFAAELVPARMYMFDQDLKTGLSIIWNRGNKADFIIDTQPIMLEKDCVMFITGLHNINSYAFEKLNVIQFNRPFYCVEDHDSDVGCKGLLFFGASSVPKITIQPAQLKAFELIWEVLLMEIEQQDELSLEMLRSLLKRFMILCVRIYKDQNYSVVKDSVSVGLIREYNYLVEKHFKTHTSVAAYSDMLFKSPKTLSNMFKKHIDKTPLQIINERRLLEAQRLLTYSDLSIQEIAEELSFGDVPAFSHFFKKNSGTSPSKFRNRLS